MLIIAVDENCKYEVSLIVKKYSTKIENMAIELIENAMEDAGVNGMVTLNVMEYKNDD